MGAILICINDRCNGTAMFILCSVTAASPSLPGPQMRFDQLPRMMPSSLIDKKPIKLLDRQWWRSRWRRWRAPLGHSEPCGGGAGRPGVDQQSPEVRGFVLHVRAQRKTRRLGRVWLQYRVAPLLSNQAGTTLSPSIQWLLFAARCTAAADAVTSVVDSE